MTFLYLRKSARLVILFASCSLNQDSIRWRASGVLRQDTLLSRWLIPRAPSRVNFYWQTGRD